jgi:hypothetical protein
MAKRSLPRHFPEEGQSFTFGVYPETHSPRLKDTSVGDLVRRVADVVPRTHKVDLAPERQQKTVLLACVGQNVMLSVVDDWHAFHKYNIREVRKEAQEAAD